MKYRLIALAALAGALSGCATTGPASNPIESYWKGKSAGTFFARFAPPVSDVASGSATIYTWRGGYNRIKTQDGRSMRVSCTAQITADADYRIQQIRIVADRPGARGPSYCTELLVGE